VDCGLYRIVTVQGWPEGTTQSHNKHELVWLITVVYARESEARADVVIRGASAHHTEDDRDAARAVIGYTPSRPSGESVSIVVRTVPHSSDGYKADQVRQNRTE